MNEEELFCKLFPEYAVNGKPLSPYFDLFERGYEESENRIEELEEVRSKQVDLINRDTIRMENQKYQIEKLEKENAELKKNYEDSLVACGVLKEKIDLMTKPTPIEVMQDALITAQKVAYEKQKDQLTKAKELLKKLLSAYTTYADSFDDRDNEIVEEAEQFISEVDK